MIKNIDAGETAIEAALARRASTGTLCHEVSSCWLEENGLMIVKIPLSFALDKFRTPVECAAVP